MSTTAIARTTAPPLSQSRRALMACAVLYRARMIQGVKEAPNEAALRGTEIHEAAHDYVEYLVRNRKSSDADWFVHNILSRSYRPDALAILEEADAADVFNIDPERVLGTELRLTLDADMNPMDGEQIDELQLPIAVEGTLDRVDTPEFGYAVIHDYKSTFALFDAEDSFQALVYPFLLFKHFSHIEKVKFVLHFVRYGSASREVTYTRADLPEMEKTIRRERERQLAIHADPFAVKATPGAACTYCPLLTKACKGIRLDDNGNYSSCSGGADCPECNGNSCPVASVNPYGEMSLEDRAQYALYLAAAKKENDRVMRDFCNIEPIQVRDGNGKLYQIGYSKQEKSSYPVIECLPIVREKDPELAGKLSLSGLSTPLKAKKRAELRELIAPHKVINTQSRFGITGVEDSEDDAEE